MHLCTRSLSGLPWCLQQLVHIRLASTQASSTARTSADSTQSYPFPSHRQPSPNEIFHLPPGSTQRDIKKRYYELVRLYHPDSNHGSSIPPETRHKRFQSISAAYDVLRGKSSSKHLFRGGQDGDGDMDAEIMRRKKAFYTAAAANGNWDDATYRGDRSYDSAFGRERWKTTSAEDSRIDGTILWGSAFLIILTFVPFFAHSPHVARLNVTKAAHEHYVATRAEAKENGQARKLAIKKKLRAAQIAKQDSDDSPKSETCSTQSSSIEERRGEK